MIAVRTLCARWERCEHAVNTLQQLLARRRSVMDAIKMLWEHCVNAVGTLWGRCVHAITSKFDIFRCVSQQTPHRADRFLERFVWCDGGLT